MHTYIKRDITRYLANYAVEIAGFCGKEYHLCIDTIKYINETYKGNYVKLKYDVDLSCLDKETLQAILSIQCIDCNSGNYLGAACNGCSLYQVMAYFYDTTYKERYQAEDPEYLRGEIKRLEKVIQEYKYNEEVKFAPDSYAIEVIHAESITNNNVLKQIYKDAKKEIEFRGLSVD